MVPPMTAHSGGGKPSNDNTPGVAGANEGRPLAVIVAGPTASGKSALAMALAARVGGTVINADSMQIYRELRVLTARPSVADEAAVPHALYGVRAAGAPGSVAWWRGAALAEMAACRAAGRVPILCGGTGMYFQSLIQGLAEIPAPSEAARAEARGLLAEIGPVALHARLAGVDPATAARLETADGQRLARAWEVWRSTGRGLAAWQADGNAGRAPWRFRAVLIDPPREVLREAIAARFDAMLEEGALEEARALWALGLDAALPAMRAHGVPELGRYLRGECSLDVARARACVVTAQYTKRQVTWFRHHALAGEGEVKNLLARWDAGAQVSESDIADMQNFMFARVDVVPGAP